MSVASVHAHLMRQMGTPAGDGFDPMPPRQHSYLLDRKEPAKNRAIAWVWSKTIRPGIGRRRTPQAHDKRGDLTHIQAAKDLGWTPSNALVVFRTLEAEGRIRIDQKGVIWLRGDAPEPVVDDVQKRPDQAGEGKAKENRYIFLPPRIQLHFQHLTKTDQDRVAAEYFEVQELKDKVVADAIAAGRRLADDLEAQWCETKGIPPAVERRGRPKKPRETSVVQLSLTAPPKYVQISDAAPPEKSVHKPKTTSVQKENASVQNEHPYYSESEFSESSSSSETTEIRAALETYGPTDDDAAKTLIAECRKRRPDATVAEIADAIHTKAQKKRGKLENPTGFLLVSVPKMFEGERPPPEPAAAVHPQPTFEQQVQNLTQAAAALREMGRPADAESLEADIAALRAQFNGHAKGAHP